MPDTATMDFETYSEAGYVRHDTPKGVKWRTATTTTTSSGLAVVGAPVYSEHPSTEVVCLQYDLHDGVGPRLWLPCMPPPQPLFDHIAAGGLVEAHNSGFEYLIWLNVCVRRYGWPQPVLEQFRCSASKARAYALPGALAKAGEAIGLPSDKLKDKDGKRLINRFSKPQSPTKNQPLERLTIYDAPEDGQRFVDYCAQDIVTEEALSKRLPDLDAHELPIWLMDQRINMRGVGVDTEARDNCIAIIDQAFDKYNAELRELTGGAVETAAKLEDLKAWLATQGVKMPNMQAETIEKKLETLEAGAAKRALEIRACIGSAAVKKLYALGRRTSRDGRIRDMFNYHKAHTGRFAGQGPQPQNLPNSGPYVYQCHTCGAWHVPEQCPHCGHAATGAPQEWCVEAVEFALSLISYRNLAHVETYFGDAVAAVSGCLRGLFIAAPSSELICSDYSAIEAVVIACLAGEQWRVDVFNGHGKIYEMSASKISGIPFADMMAHKEQTGQHHPLRKKLGKVSELASAYGGGLGAWKAFGADKFMSDGEIENAKRAWRRESPNIVRYWYALEDAARNAIQCPGAEYDVRGLKFQMRGDVLFLRLLSGRSLKYHQPRIVMQPKWGKSMPTVTFMGVDGLTGQWCRKDTFGGRLCENVVQATARDIFTNGMQNVESAGYPLVLHTHDETISEVPVGYGSVEEYEKLLTTLPAWCADWPIRAAGGWRGKRYRKD